jgi:hypothetical protein
MPTRRLGLLAVAAATASAVAGTGPAHPLITTMTTATLEPLESRRLLSATTTAVADAPADLPPAGKILFIRGADRSGGFLEANNDFGRTEQLASIFNDQTFGGNHGWGELATALENHGYELTEVAEPIEAGAPATGQVEGAPLDLAALDLLQYDAVVFGSNNAIYGPDAVAVFEDYVRRGGGTLFISDANFGSGWGDAPRSDQPFLDVLGWQMNQDRGTYSLIRNDGDYVVPQHPILIGPDPATTTVDRFDGEGVSPINVANATVGQRLVVAKGQTSDADGELGRNPGRPVTDDDSSLASAQLDGGRVVGHFDRNTFFNQNGAGTNINRFDNEQYALNLFDFVSGRFGDERAPEAGAAVDLETRQAIVFTFDEDVAETVDASDLSVINQTTGQPVDASDFELVIDDFGRRATFVYDVDALGTLPDGNYVATLDASGVTDRVGNALAAPASVSFQFLAGDADGSGTVELADFTTLRNGFGSSPATFSTGDFNYDGTVDLADFTILRNNFGNALTTTSPVSLFAEDEREQS